MQHSTHEPMNGQEKWERFRGFLNALPYLEVPLDETGELKASGRIRYKGHPVLDYTANLFYGQLWYGDFYVGGRSPFYCVRVISAEGWINWEAELKFDDDRRAPLWWNSVEDNVARTDGFWRELEHLARRIRRLSWTGIWDNLAGLECRAAYRDAVMFLGAVRWLNGGEFTLRGMCQACLRATHRQALWSAYSTEIEGG